jgi:hypothetical protein
VIIKYNNALYNIDGWKTIKYEDGYCEIEFSQNIKLADDEYDNYRIVIDLVNDDYLYDFQREHEDYDHKDLRQVRYRAEDMIYNTILKEVVRETPYIDLDKMIDVPKILNKANKEFEKEWKDDADDNTD